MIMLLLIGKHGDWQCGRIAEDPHRGAFVAALRCAFRGRGIQQPPRILSCERDARSLFDQGNRPQSMPKPDRAPLRVPNLAPPNTGACMPAPVAGEHRGRFPA